MGCMAFRRKLFRRHRSECLSYDHENIYEEIEDYLIKDIDNTGSEDPYEENEKCDISDSFSANFDDGKTKPWQITRDDREENFYYPMGGKSKKMGAIYQEMFKKGNIELEFETVFFESSASDKTYNVNTTDKVYMADGRRSCAMSSGPDFAEEHIDSIFTKNKENTSVADLDSLGLGLNSESEDEECSSSSSSSIYRRVPLYNDSYILSSHSSSSDDIWTSVPSTPSSSPMVPRRHYSDVCRFKRLSVDDETNRGLNISTSNVQSDIYVNLKPKPDEHNYLYSQIDKGQRSFSENIAKKYVGASEKSPSRTTRVLEYESSLYQVDNERYHRRNKNNVLQDLILHNNGLRI